MNGGRPFKVVWHFGGFVGLLFAVVAIFFVIPLLLQSFYAHLALQTGFTLLMASTLYTIVNRKAIWTADSDDTLHHFRYAEHHL